MFPIFLQIHIVEMVEDPEKVLEQMRPYLQWNIGADLLFKELQHCLTPEIQVKLIHPYFLKILFQFI